MGVEGRIARPRRGSLGSRRARCPTALDTVAVMGLTHIYLGILTAFTQPSPEALREAIRKTQSLTSKPFGVNILLQPSPNPPDYEAYARAAVEEGVKIFETAGMARESLFLAVALICRFTW